MIETIVKGYLEAKLDIPVLFEKPTSANIKEYVVLQKTGSSKEDFVELATIAVQSYSDSKYHAALLNENVKDALLGDGTNTFGIIAAEDISKCSLNSDYDFTDLTTKEYRYQAVFDFVF